MRLTFLALSAVFLTALGSGCGGDVTSVPPPVSAVKAGPPPGTSPEMIQPKEEPKAKAKKI